MQKEYQELKMEKEQLLGKVEDLEQQKIILEANEMHAQEEENKLRE